MHRNNRELTTTLSGSLLAPKVFAFPVLAAILFLFFFASSAPSPLFVVFQSRWGFSSGMLTVAFGIYAITLLIVLLVAGSLSDHLGRRPVIIAALVIQIAAMILFLTAHGIGGLIAARVTQGLSMGVVNGALSAAIVEAAPVSRKRLGALVSSVSPLAGLAAGALVTGFSVALTRHAEIWIFGALAVVFPVCAALVLRVPETTSRRPGAFKSLVPRVSVAPRAWPGFVRGLPLLLVVWALCGFFIALAPSLLLHVFGVDSGGLDGLTVAVLCGAGAVSPTLLGSLRPSTSAAIGMVAISVGLVILLASLGIRSLGPFFVGAAIAGAGSGAAFSGLVQSLAPLADAHERAELFAAIFVATYLSLSLPPILAGFLIASFGFVQTTQAYLAVLLVVAIASAGIQWFASRRRFGA